MIKGYKFFRSKTKYYEHVEVFHDKYIIGFLMRLRHYDMKESNLWKSYVYSNPNLSVKTHHVGSFKHLRNAKINFLTNYRAVLLFAEIHA